MSFRLSGFDCLCVNVTRFPLFVTRLLAPTLMAMHNDYSYRTEPVDAVDATRCLQRVRYVGDEQRPVALAHIPGGLIVVWSAAHHVRDRRMCVYEFDRAGFELVRRLLAAADQSYLYQEISPREHTFIDVALIDALSTLQDAKAYASASVINSDDDDDDSVELPDNFTEAYMMVNEMVMLQISDGVSVEQAAASPRVAVQTCARFSPIAHPLVRTVQRMASADVRDHSPETARVVEWMCRAFASAMCLLDRDTADHHLWRSVEQFYIAQLAFVYRYTRGDKLGATRSSAQSVLDSGLAFQGLSLAKRPTAAAVAQLAARAVANETTRAKRFVDELFDTHHLAPVIAAYQTIDSLRTVRDSARACAARRVPLDELRAFVLENRLFAFQVQRLRSDLHVVLRLSARQATPLKIVSSILTFCPSVGAPTDYDVCWAPSAYSIPRQAPDSSQSADVYVVATNAVFSTLAHAAGCLLSIRHHDYDATTDSQPPNLVATTCAALHSPSIETCAVGLYSLQRLVTAHLNVENDVWLQPDAATQSWCLQSIATLLELTCDSSSDDLTRALLAPYVELHRASQPELPRRTLIGALHAILAGPRCDMFIDQASLVGLASCNSLEPALLHTVRALVGLTNDRVVAPQAAPDSSQCVTCCATRSTCVQLHGDRLQSSMCCLCAATLARRRRDVALCSDCIARANTPLRTAAGYIGLSGAMTCSTEQLISELLRVRAVDALYGLAPAKSNIVMPVVLPHNPTLNGYYAGASRNRSSDDQRRIAAEQNRVFTLNLRRTVAVVSPAGTAPVARLCCVVALLAKLTLCDHAELVSLATAESGVGAFYRVSGLTTDDLLRLCNTHAMSAQVEASPLFPLCASAIVESTSERAYGVESSASDFTLTSRERLVRCVSMTQRTPRPLVGALPLLLPLALCNIGRADNTQ